MQPNESLRADDDSRQRPVVFKYLEWSPLILSMVLSFGTLISFCCSYSNGTVSSYFPFISETGAYPPGSLIFSLFLIFGSVIGGCIVIFRNFIVDHILAPENHVLRKMNNVSVILGLLSMTGLAGVAAIPMSTVLWAHLVAAAIHFGCALLYSILQTIISFVTPECSTVLKYARIILCGLIILFTVGLVCMFPIAHSVWQQHNKKQVALKTPEDQGFAIALVTSLCEWLMYGSWLAYFGTFFSEFRTFNLLVAAIPR